MAGPITDFWLISADNLSKIDGIYGGYGRYDRFDHFGGFDGFDESDGPGVNPVGRIVFFKLFLDPSDQNKLITILRSPPCMYAFVFLQVLLYSLASQILLFSYVGPNFSYQRAKAKTTITVNLQSLSFAMNPTLGFLTPTYP